MLRGEHRFLAVVGMFAVMSWQLGSGKLNE
jgi:hypothetical protein